MRKVIIPIILVLLIGFITAEDYGTHTNAQPLNIVITSNNATQCNITYIQTPNNTITITSYIMQKESTAFNYSLAGTNFLTNGLYCFGISCYDGSTYETGSICKEVTPTGKTQTQAQGSISVWILYFLAILGTALIFFGITFLGRDYVWVWGILSIALGFMLYYYGLHLTNLYATTINYTSGAGNTTTGAFTFIATLLKYIPYVVSVIAVFMIVRLFRDMRKQSKSSDGWDNNNYD